MTLSVLLCKVILAADIVFVVGFHPEYFSEAFTYPGIIFIGIAVIAGLGVSAFGPAALAVLADSSNQGNRGTSAGIYSLLMGLGEIVGEGDRFL